jgi:hypothetical protein
MIGMLSGCLFPGFYPYLDILGIIRILKLASNQLDVRVSAIYGCRRFFWRLKKRAGQTKSGQPHTKNCFDLTVTDNFVGSGPPHFARYVGRSTTGKCGFRWIVGGKRAFRGIASCNMPSASN